MTSHANQEFARRKENEKKLPIPTKPVWEFLQLGSSPKEGECTKKDKGQLKGPLSFFTTRLFSRNHPRINLKQATNACKWIKNTRQTFNGIPKQSRLLNNRQPKNPNNIVLKVITCFHHKFEFID